MCISEIYSHVVVSCRAFVIVGKHHYITQCVHIIANICHSYGVYICTDGVKYLPFSWSLGFPVLHSHDYVGPIAPGIQVASCCIIVFTSILSFLFTSISSSHVCTALPYYLFGNTDFSLWILGAKYKNFSGRMTTQLKGVMLYCPERNRFVASFLYHLSNLTSKDPIR